MGLPGMKKEKNKDLPRSEIRGPEKAWKQAIKEKWPTHLCDKGTG